MGDAVVFWLVLVLVGVVALVIGAMVSAAVHSPPAIGLWDWLFMKRKPRG